MEIIKISLRIIRELTLEFMYGIDFVYFSMYSILIHIFSRNYTEYYVDSTMYFIIYKVVYDKSSIYLSYIK